LRNFGDDVELFPEKKDASIGYLLKVRLWLF